MSTSLRVDSLLITLRPLAMLAITEMVHRWPPVRIVSAFYLLWRRFPM